MGRAALLVIDMLHDFLDPAGALYCGDQAAAIIPRVRQLLEEHRQKGSLIIFVADSHPPDDLEFKLFAPHCLEDSPGAQLLPGLAALPGEHLVKKRRYSAFYGTELEDILRRHQVNEAHLCGVCTSICVMETCSDLRDRDLHAVVHQEAVADFDPEAHAYALKRIQNILGGALEP
ncbi:MAG: cysteine hydrolase [Desulfarculus sp.]|nr:cysteine hydrolase [Desulfarculus sp.]